MLYPTNAKDENKKQYDVMIEQYNGDPKCSRFDTLQKRMQYSIEDTARLERERERTVVLVQRTCYLISNFR